MKAFYTLAAILLYSVCLAQSEFSTTDNGLIYSKEAVGKLKHIVDSLNLKFKVCESKAFYAKLQGKADYIIVEGSAAKQAQKDIIAGISYPDFIKKYPEAIIYNDLVIGVYRYEDYQKNKIVSFDIIDLDESNAGYEVSEKDFKEQRWYVSYYEPGKYNKEEANIFYFTEGFSSKIMNEKYSRLVQYSECLIDSTATVYLEKAKETGVRYSSNKGKADSFMTYINKKTKRPVLDWDGDDNITDEEADKKYEAYSVKMDEWEKTKLSAVDLLMKSDKKAQKLFREAVNATTEGKEIAGDEFEEYIARYDSKEHALYLKRNRRVIGGCSQDNSPRIHALNIAELAAETTKWDIFLRAHLDIMNDNFERVSDGSYAYAGRKTYIKELEVLDINVADLLLGICLRVENASENHYFGSIGRTGRALAESKDRDVIESEILKMIADNDLDDYNRVLMYYLFLNYNGNLEDETERKDNLERLRVAVAQMPDYIKNKIVIKA